MIARVLSEPEDHPHVEVLHSRALAIDPGISIATVCRTVRLFEEASVFSRHDFGDGKLRCEPAPDAHHDHLINVETGQAIEFVDHELEAMQKAIAEHLGYCLVNHHLEFFAVKALPARKLFCRASIA